MFKAKTPVIRFSETADVEKDGKLLEQEINSPPLLAGYALVDKLTLAGKQSTAERATGRLVKQADADAPTAIRRQQAYRRA